MAVRDSWGSLSTCTTSARAGLSTIALAKVRHSVVVANFSGQAVENYSIGPAWEWKLRFNSDAKVYDAEFGDFPSGNVTAIEEGQDGLPARRGGDWGVQRVDLFAGRGIGTVKNVPGTWEVPGTSRRYFTRRKSTHG